MPRTLIIGYGNPLRGDDGVGVRAAEWLAEELGSLVVGGGETPPLPGAGVEVIACQQLNIELAAAVAEADRLILMDASAGGTPGVLTEHTLAPVSPPQTGASLSHYLHPASLLATAQILYGKAPPATLLTISGAAFDHGETLSPPVAAALPRLVARVRQLVGQA